MKKFFVTFIWLFSLLLTNGILSAAESEVNSVLASVNGEIITLMDVMVLTRNKEIYAGGVYSGDRLVSEIRNYRKTAVDDLIDNILLQREFEQKQFSLDPADIEREINQMATRAGCHARSQFERYLRDNGTSIEEVRMSIRKNMMVQLMLFRKIKIADPVTPREMYEFFKANEASFALPDKISLAMLKLDSSHRNMDDEIAKINSILEKNPDEFGKLIKIYSPNLGGGELGEVERKQLRPEFAAAFSEFKLNKIAGPVKVYDGVVWLKVLSYKPAPEVKFKDVEERIKLELERKKRENVIKDYTRGLRSDAMIEYYF